MDDRLRDNQQVLALVAGVALLGVGLLVWIADAATYAALGLALVLIGAAFIALGLFGDRITEMTAGAFGFKMVARRFTERAKQVIEGKAELRAQASVTATADVVSKESHDEGRGEDRTDGPVVITPEPAKLKLQTFPPEVRVERAASALAQAVTPEELAERAIEFVRVAGPDRATVLQYLSSLDSDERAALLDEAERAGRPADPTGDPVKGRPDAP